jgi:hypothetical protein
VPLSPSGRQGVTLCRNTRCDFGAEVYRKSTGVSGPEQSAVQQTGPAGELSGRDVARTAIAQSTCQVGVEQISGIVLLLENAKPSPSLRGVAFLHAIGCG